VSRNPTLHGKERQRHQGAETAENDAQGEKGSEGFAGAIGPILDFRVLGIKDQPRDHRRRTERGSMRDEMPPRLGVIVMRTAAVQIDDRSPG
jgi:hypothetical protein